MLARRFCFVFAIICFMTTGGLAGAQVKRAIDPEDIVDLRWVSVRSLSLSPDGKRVAYSLVEWDKSGKKAKRKYTLWLVPTDGSKAPYRVAPKHSQVRKRQWSSDGRYLAFLSKKDGKDSKSQIYLMTAGDLKVEQLTNVAGGVQDFAWSPDTKAIAYTTFAPQKKKLDNAPIEVDKHPKNARLELIQLANKQVKGVTNGKKHVVNFTWAPDGKQFAVLLAPSSHLDDMFGKTDLVVMEPSGKIVRALSRKATDGFKLSWSPDGKFIVFDRFTPKQIARDLAVVNACGGKHQYPLKDYRGTRSWTVRWDRDSRRLLVQTFEKTRNRILRVDASTGRFERVAESVQNFWNFDVSRDGKTLILNEETGKKPPEIVVFENGRKTRQLTNINPHVAKWPLGEVKEIHWKNKRDGKVIYGVLITPPGFKPGKRYPTIVELHGGPQGNWWAGWLGTYLSRAQYFASHGYVTFLPNPRGSIGMGTEFVEANYQDWGGMDVQDILDGVDYLVDKKIAEPNRLAVGGGSYGGFLTAMITGKTNRFRAAVVDMGVTDLVTWNLTCDISWPGRIYMGGDEFERRKIYRKCSPFTYIRNCKTPTLVLHGEKDKRVPLSQGRLWYKTLRHLGVETEMVVYPGAGHGLTERAHQIDAMKRVLRWYQKYLKCGR